MRKYLEVAKIYMKAQLAWRSDVLFNIIFTITKMLFAYLLWGIMFEGKSMIGQFTFHSMLSYCIISSFLSQLEMSQRVSSEIHDRIRNGTFSKYMIIPMGIEKYFFSMQAGIVAFYFSFQLIASMIWIWLFNIQFTFTENKVALICAIVMIILGMIFMVQLNYLLGLLTLKYQGIGTFLMVKDNLMELITGSIIPLALFPESVVAFMRLLPFYYVTYLPSMILTGQCEGEALLGVGIIAIWCIVIQLIIAVVWKKYIRKYDGVGI